MVPYKSWLGQARLSRSTLLVLFINFPIIVSDYRFTTVQALKSAGIQVCCVHILFLVLTYCVYMPNITRIKNTNRYAKIVVYSRQALPKIGGKSCGNWKMFLSINVL